MDHVDVVNDQMWPSDYLDTEDPTLFVSEKTGRGPLDQAWIDDADTIMCAYKLCKVRRGVLTNLIKCVMVSLQKAIEMY